MLLKGTGEVPGNIVNIEKLGYLLAGIWNLTEAWMKTQKIKVNASL